ncbi:response regulator [Cohnella phaseoli]|uniref:Two-component system response regulator YesN n=1 Tax=Cohnella phaseoli TaxID=456490 RepID=A0A3D9JQW0_9BACL|nr:response regulator [Cohnella phaseoli]RED76424.1 two-component system response regulator YesN [Cohnella phaseoli]
MNRLLIVDDLTIIVQSMVQLFEDLHREDLEILSAGSAMEALNLMKSVKVDIVLTDIKMPGMTGLEMLKQIKEHWPRCKVIFLTSYSDFKYSKEAISLGAFDYILKTEDDEIIVETVDKAIQALNEEFERDELYAKTKEQLQESLPYTQRSYLGDLLRGKQVSAEVRRHQFDLLQIPLDPAKPVFVTIGRIDRQASDNLEPEEIQSIYLVQHVFEEYAPDRFRYFAIPNEPSKCIWLIQRIESGAESDTLSDSFSSWLTGIFEDVQNTCRNLFQIPLSVLIGSKPVDWRDIAQKYDDLCLELGWGLGVNREILVTDEELTDRTANHDENLPEEGEEGRPRFERLNQLTDYLENNQRWLFFQTFEEYLDISFNSGTAVYHRLGYLHGLASILVYYISKTNRRAVNHELYDPKRIYSAIDSESASEIKSRFTEAALYIFDCIEKERREQSHGVIEKIQNYVEHNLMNDVSLTTLAKLVNFNSSYLSRLYKQMTGRGLREYVLDLKLEKAQYMLLESDMKVQNIAQAVGYQSSLAFSRFFKSQTQMTPQEYREVKKSMEKRS